MQKRNSTSTAKQTAVANSVLRALSHEERQRVLARCEQVTLTYGDILVEPGDRVKHVYFPNQGLISLLTPLDGHASVEVGMVGSEGMAGVSLVLGISVSPVRALVQGSGTALRMKAATFRNEIKSNPALLIELNHYLYMFMAQVAQTAACNRHHQLDSRLARWLLMTHDRMQSNTFLLTQEFLAHMLGVRRVGVTKAATMLQNKKLISYRRGLINILDRKGLERASCRCYGAVNAIRAHMLN
ncbi:MAG: Crp/Fnr family transcriptional regulator [Sulfuricaulis sp.]|uniref:Crp/Fnr family transcriptional regulator n=1 Tax=Sulfuricaulis sp. TaxID=2003553 RepID=UPI0025FFE4F0|nr:Crp/Fnr family transcriptional regulator [Sulfuricaulis sp.]MCR4346431.1 Crp/Fnr family transcriptional regulator [Sulfuricaulis sp.]